MSTEPANTATVPSTASAAASGKPLPLVVHLGFAGSRTLFDRAARPDLDAGAFETALAGLLAQRIEKLRADLGLEDRHFFCGISQIAIGGDSLFTRACAALRMPHRIFLAQHQDAYLSAIGSAGPDFTEPQQAAARVLLAGENVIQERVVSDAPERRERFYETNLEIVRVSDVVICLLASKGPGKLGGTHELIEMARKRRRPLLALHLTVVDGKPVLEEAWHGLCPLGPHLPKELDAARITTSGPGLPSVTAYCEALKELGSQQAKWKRHLFKIAALIIIGTHILATVCAVVALSAHGLTVIPWFLGIELLLLAAGFTVHHYLHHSHASGVWPKSRVAAEVARSMNAIGGFHCYLDYLFKLPFSEIFRPLLRTVSVLHLHSTHATPPEDWKRLRDEYVRKRLVDPDGQLDYNRKTREVSRHGLRLARRTFLACSILAFAATLFKLLALCHAIPMDHEAEQVATAIFGSLAIILPVLAVSGLSLSAAFDLEARSHISQEMEAFLKEQVVLLNEATSSREYARLLLETESRLLGETANWYSRRSFTGVA